MTAPTGTAAATEPDAKFWDRIAEKYSRRPVPDEAVYRRKLEITRSYFTPDSDVLEFGCGTGSTAIAHAPFVRHILAADISQGMIDIARRKADGEGISNVTFRRAAFDTMDAEEARFDAVLGMSILHLVENRDEAIAKAYKMLKPGGVFISSTACLGDNLKIFKLIAPIARFFGFFPLVRVLKTGELIASMESAGFRIEHNWKPEKGPAVFLIARKPV